jgi:hypothetical protein
MFCWVIASIDWGREVGESKLADAQLLNQIYRIFDHSVHQASPLQQQ